MYITSYLRRIFSIVFPLASSSTSLSRYLISCINGSSMFSTRTPHTVPVIIFQSGFNIGAHKKKSPYDMSESRNSSICSNVVTRKPRCDFQNFVFCAILLFRLCYQHRVNFCKAHCIYFFRFSFSTSLYSLASTV